MVFFNGLQFSFLVDLIRWQQYMYIMFASLVFIVDKSLVWLSRKCIGFIVFFATLIADHKVEL